MSFIFSIDIDTCIILIYPDPHTWHSTAYPGNKYLFSELLCGANRATHWYLQMLATLLLFALLLRGNAFGGKWTPGPSPTPTIISSCDKGEQLFVHPPPDPNAVLAKACHLRYCNGYSQLKTDYCGGAECTTDEQAQECHNHWMTKGRYENSFQTLINVDSCAAESSKMVPLERGASDGVSASCGLAGCLYDAGKCPACMSGGTKGSIGTGNVIEEVRDDMETHLSSGACGLTDRDGGHLWEVEWTGASGYTSCIDKCVAAFFFFSIFFLCGSVALTLFVFFFKFYYLLF